ncbi:unnamed protein product [Caenorhabditis bovis]|uniref:Uncharacterized protein n=1 Tax=Caenorhabditis bovis TaxID=2654633 RepID=A0A8S1F158_9PELO|nr:unnamed protein product [Caenorhabditis bovis]
MAMYALSPDVLQHCLHSNPENVVRAVTIEIEGDKSCAVTIRIDQAVVIPSEKLHPALDCVVGSGGERLSRIYRNHFHKLSTYLADPRKFFIDYHKKHVRVLNRAKVPKLKLLGARYDEMMSISDQIRFVGNDFDHMIIVLLKVSENEQIQAPESFVTFLAYIFPLDSSKLTDEQFIKLILQCLSMMPDYGANFSNVFIAWLLSKSDDTNSNLIKCRQGKLEEIDSSFFFERTFPLFKIAMERYLDSGMAKYSRNPYVEMNVCKILTEFQTHPDLGKFLNGAFLVPAIRKYDEWRIENAKRANLFHKAFGSLIQLTPAEFIWDFINYYCDTNINCSDVWNDTEKVHEISTVLGICFSYFHDFGDASDQATQLCQRILEGFANPNVLRANSVLDLSNLFISAEICLKSARIFPLFYPERYCHRLQTYRYFKCHALGLFNSLLDAILTIADFHMRDSRRILKIVDLIEYAELFVKPSSILNTKHDNFEASHVSTWVKKLVNVFNFHKFLTEMKAGECRDMEIFISLLEFICRMYMSSATPSRGAMIHDQNRFPLFSNPILKRCDLRFIDSQGLFESCAEALWIGLESNWCRHWHVTIRRLLIQIHSRDLSKPSSEVEKIIVQRLQSSDETIREKTIYICEVMSGAIMTSDKPFDSVSINIFSI